MSRLGRGQGMECPRCGFAMGAFDVECRRCAHMRQLSQDAQPSNEQEPTPLPPPPPPALETKVRPLAYPSVSPPPAPQWQLQQQPGRELLVSRPHRFSNVKAGILAVLLGQLGAHKFYNGSWGWGIVYASFWVISLTVSLAFISPDSGLFHMGGLIVCAIGLGEGLMYLCSKSTYDRRYNDLPDDPWKF